MVFRGVQFIFEKKLFLENTEDLELGKLVTLDEVHDDDSAPKEPLLTIDSVCGNNSENVVPDNHLFVTPSPSAKKCHLPAAHVQVKTSSVLSNLFR